MSRQQRRDLLAMYHAALSAVRGDLVVEQALRAGVGRPGAPVEVLAAGKAAVAMLRPLSQLGDRLIRGFAVSKEAEGPAPPRCELMTAGHPIPDLRSLRAGRAWLERARACPPRHDLWVLLSGGASSLLSVPSPGLTLEDLQSATGLLLRAGADIESLNAVRKHLGAVGGGQSLQASRSACVEVLTISDVADDRLDVIGSGPFCADTHRYQDALAAFERLGLGAAIPDAVNAHLLAGARGARPETLKPGDPALERVRHRVVASLADALRAAETAGRERGFRVLAWPERLAGEAREEARSLAQAARRAPPGSCLVAGGEPIVTVRGPGKGGRAQELALALAIELEGNSDVVALAATTDGSDGPTDAAGAWADGGSVARGRARGWDARAALVANDSHGFFAGEGGLLHTGPTGTNVNDLVLVATA